MTEIKLESTLTCPHCGFAETLTMPVDSCLWAHTCESCKAELRPKAGDCCVFCSYGDVPCPDIQRSGKRGSEN